MNSNLLKELLASRVNERHLSYREAAKEIGVSHTTVSRILNGESAGDIDTLVHICRWLEISPSKVLDSYNTNDVGLDAAITAIIQFTPEFKQVLEEAAARIERQELDPSFMKELVGYIRYRLSTQ